MISVMHVHFTLYKMFLSVLRYSYRFCILGYMHIYFIQYVHLKPSFQIQVTNSFIFNLCELKNGMCR